MNKIRLHLKNDIKDLELMIRELDRISSLWQIPMRQTMNINLILEEIITNIVFYAYDDNKDHSIIVSLEKVNDTISIFVEDDGKPFNILEAEDPKLEDLDVEQRQIGGLGIHFVKKLADKIVYDRKEGKNILHIVKSIV